MTTIARVWAVLLLCSATGVAFTAAEPTAMKRTGHFQLRVDDAVVPDARLYLAATGLPRLLVVDDHLASALVIVPGGKSGSVLQPSAVTPDAVDADLINVDLDAKAGADFSTSVDGSKISAQISGKRVTVEPKDPMLGEYTPDQLLAALPEWRRNLAAYKPTVGDLKLLATVRTDTQIEVFFGSWCPHCEESIPRLLKVLRELNNPALHFRFFGVPLKFNDDPTARQNRVVGLPTAVVRRGDKEIARVVDASWRAPEETLSAIFFGEGSLDSPSGS